MKKIASYRVSRWIWLILCTCPSLGCQSKPAGPAEETPADFKGKVFQVAIAEDSLVRDAVRKRLNEWEFRTESKVELVTASDAKTLLAIQEGSTLAEKENAKPIPDSVLDLPLVDFHLFPPLYRLKFCKRGDHVVWVPLTTDLVLVWYREDLFNDESIQNSFHEQTGKTLQAPETWADYLEIARFFADHDSVPFGCVEPLADNTELTRTFFVHCAAYAKTSDWSSFAIDTETGKPRLNTPPFVRGLDEMKAAFACSPGKQGKWTTALEADTTFREGQAAMLLSRFSPMRTGLATANKDAGKKGSLAAGVAELPGSLEVFDPRKQAFETKKTVNRCVHFATTGTYVTMESDNPASKLILPFLLDKQESVYLMNAARHGVLPVRSELLAEPERFSAHGLSQGNTQKLLGVVRSSLLTTNWVADLRIPLSKALEDSLATHLRSALQGEVSSTQALQSADEAWNTLLSDQKDFLKKYRQSLGLPDLN